MKKLLSIYTFILSIVLLSACKSTSVDEIVLPTEPPVTNVKSDVAYWLTTPDAITLFRKQNIALNFGQPSNTNTTIEVDTTKTFQPIDGFGFALTGGSASLINSLDATTKQQLLTELFGTDSTYIGISYLRISIGASDLDSAPYTFDEIGGSQADYNLTSFTMEKAQTDLIPVLKAIAAINPAIKIIATPWTAPTWMKTNGSFSGGSLKPECYDAYARYFVKFIQTMKAQGITIEAVTPQNEPLNAYNNPAMVMSADEEANFIKNYLGPQFQANNITTKIVIYDHNLDHPEYPTAILNDPVAASYVDGSAFHLYAGDIGTMSSVHTMFPNKNLYFTEQYTSSTGSFSGDLPWHIRNLIIGATRNWSRNVIEWNLASDPNLGPHTSGGCSTCLGAITIGTTYNRNVSYYVIAHAAKYVRPGSVRIGTDIVGDLQNVAFKNPAGQKVLIVLNTGSSTETFNIKFNGKTVSPSLPSGAVGTFIWK
jgi:glucosylceramidase